MVSKQRIITHTNLACTFYFVFKTTKVPKIIKNIYFMAHSMRENVCHKQNLKTMRQKILLSLLINPT